MTIKNINSKFYTFVFIIVEKTFRKASNLSPIYICIGRPNRRRSTTAAAAAAATTGRS
jgi:hypothetical protein